MPIMSAELRPNVTLPLESKPELDNAKLESIKQIATQVTGEKTSDPVDANSKIVIEVNDEPQQAEISETVSPVESNPGFFSNVSHQFERLGNLRRTLLLNRFGTTKSKKGLEASVERAVDKAEQQGQQVTSVKT